MEIKSRYEIIQELEAKKRTLIQEKANLADVLRVNKRRFEELKEDTEAKIKTLKREEKNFGEDVDNLETSLPEKKETYDTLIKSIDESLEKIQSQK